MNRPFYSQWAFSLLVLFSLFASSLGISLARVDTTPAPAPTGTDRPQARGRQYAPAFAAGDPYDLLIELSVPTGDLTPKLGDTINFTITVTNLGNQPVTGIIVKYLLPNGLTYKSDDGAGTYNSVTGYWTVGSLPGNPNPTPTPAPNSAQAKLRVSATVSNILSMTSTAQIWSADQADPYSANNTSLPVTIDPQKADLSLTLTTDNPTPNRVNAIVRFTITVLNSGPKDAQNVTVKDLFPPSVGLDYQSDDGGGTYNPSTGIWAVGTLLASGPGSSDTLTIVTKVTNSSSRVNAAEVWTSDQFDPDSRPGNGLVEDDYASVAITPQIADLSLTKVMNTPLNQAPGLGEAVTFTVTISNAGPNPATNVQVQDVIPLDYGSVTAVPSMGTYAAGIWDVGTLAANGPAASATLIINATTLLDGVSTNWAEVYQADQFDPDSKPNDSSRNTDDDAGAPTADLSLAMTYTPKFPAVGSNVQITVTVTNGGPGKASGVVVRDILPPELTRISDNSGGQYDLNPGPTYGNWTVGNLAPGVSASLTIIARIETPALIKNTAEVWASNQYDLDSTPNNAATSEDDYASIAIDVLTPPKSVVITEVGWMGTTVSADDEWIELYNPTNDPIDLTGWEIRSFRVGFGNQVYVNILFNATTCKFNCIINPGQFFLLERDTDDTVSNIAADLVYAKTSSNQLSNSGELLLLCTPANITADKCKPTTNNLPLAVDDIANIETSTNGTPAASNPWPAGSASSLSSMERKSLLSNEDTNWFTYVGPTEANNCTYPKGKDANGVNLIKGTPKCPNWAFDVTATPRATSTPTRTPTRVPEPAPVLVLNEFVARPGHDWNNDGEVNTYDEFIEVINAGQVSLNLSQYKLDDYEQDATGAVINNGWNLPSRTLEPGQIAVFYASETGIFLSDAGDTVRLLKAGNNTIVDAYAYPAIKSLDVSYCRYTDGYGSWLNKCFPTPGRPNSLTGGSFPPQPGGLPSAVCLLPDNAPVEFLKAECEEGGLGVWNPSFWDSGEQNQYWFSDLWTKWLELFQ